MKGVLLYIICLYCINRWRKPIATEIPVGSIWSFVCVCISILFSLVRNSYINSLLSNNIIIGYIWKLTNGNLIQSFSSYWLFICRVQLACRVNTHNFSFIFIKNIHIAYYFKTKEAGVLFYIMFILFSSYMPTWGRSTVNRRAELVTSSSPLLFQLQVRTPVLGSV